MTTTGAPPRRPRYASVDAWRGVACLLIIGHHSSLVYSNLAGSATGVASIADAIIRAATFGNLRVPLFFVISGYCIAAAAEGVRQGRRSVSTYFFRRFRRIYPAFWIVVVCSVAFFFIVDYVLWPRLISSSPWSQPRPWWYSNWQWIGNLTLTETWREHVIGGPRGHFPGQAWTLCYEEQFYAIVGLLLWLSRRNFFAGIIHVSVATLFIALAADVTGIGISGFFFDGSWLTFAAGVLVYWTVTYSNTPRAKAAASGLLVVAAVATPWLPIPGGTTAFVFAMVLLVLHPWDGQIATSRWTKPFTYCGQMCYSLYLVHQLIVKAVSQGLWNAGLHSAPATLLVTIPACFALSIIAGRFCFVAIERRFLSTAEQTAPTADGAHAGPLTSPRLEKILTRLVGG